MSESTPCVLLGMDVSVEDRSRSYQFVYQDYVKALNQVQLLVVTCPCQSDEYLNELLDHVHGVVIPGGDDLIFDNPNEHETFVDPVRQHTDTLLIKGALERKLPLLGICYGMQLIHDVYEGELIRHLPNAQHHMKGCEHQLSACDQKKFIFDELSWMQPSFHHQGIKNLAKGLKSVVLSDDGLIEGFYDPKFSFIAGFQWHVEKRHSSADMTILRQFSKAVYSYAKGIFK